MAGNIKGVQLKKPTEIVAYTTSNAHPRHCGLTCNLHLQRSASYCQSHCVVGPKGPSLCPLRQKEDVLVLIGQRVWQAAGVLRDAAGVTEPTTGFVDGIMSCPKTTTMIMVIVFVLAILIE